MCQHLPNNHARTNHFQHLNFFQKSYLFHLNLVFFLAWNRFLWTTFIIKRIRTRTAIRTVVFTRALVFAQNQAVVAISFTRHFPATRHVALFVMSFAKKLAFLILLFRKVIAAQVRLRSCRLVRSRSSRCRCFSPCRCCRLCRGSSCWRITDVISRTRPRPCPRPLRFIRSLCFIWISGFVRVSRFVWRFRFKRMSCRNNTVESARKWEKKSQRKCWLHFRIFWQLNFLAKQDDYAKSWWKCSQRLDNLYDKQLFAKETSDFSSELRNVFLRVLTSQISYAEEFEIYNCKKVSINTCDLTNFSLKIKKIASSFSVFDVYAIRQSEGRIMQTIGFTCVIFIQIIQLLVYVCV